MIFFEQVKSELPELNILTDEPMSKHTTFKLGGVADYFATPSCDEIATLLKLAKTANMDVTIIGNGSNLLVGDKGVRGLVIEIGKAMESVVIEGQMMTVGAGTILAKAANEAANAGLGGMEFAAGIPGSMGGAVVMNAGAYGGEIKDILVSADVLTADGDIITLANEELDLSYRHSCVLEKGYIVLSVKLKLEARDESEIRQVMAELRNKRIEKQPLEYPSAGSTFKRPEGYFAGKLIEDAGLRGYTVGGACVSEKHCGFVVNKGGACAQDVLNVIKDVKAKVYEMFEVELEPEVKMIGEF